MANKGFLDVLAHFFATPSKLRTFKLIEYAILLLFVLIILMVNYYS